LLAWGEEEKASVRYRREGATSVIEKDLAKTVQGLLHHSKIQTTLDLYTQEDSDETRAAQGAYLSAVGLQGRTIQ